MDRRKFIRTTGLLTLSGFAASSLINSCKKDSVTAPTVNFTIDLSQSPYTVLNTPGGSVSKNGVVIFNASGTIKALSEGCTHEGCAVSYNASGNKLICPCHGGQFDTNGNVTAGPPPSSLKKYTVTQSGTMLTVAG